MAQTGIILRRKIGKNLFTGSEVPIPGELVMDLETTNFGFLSEDGVTIKWGKLEDELPAGGVAGQVLAKKTNIDGDTEWINPPSTGIPDAPSDGNIYSRKDASWINISTDLNSIGDLTTLTTTDKSSLVNAINEVNASSGGEVIKITETDSLGNNKTGYVFSSDDRSTKASIGNNAIDFSFIIPAGTPA